MLDNIAGNSKLELLKKSTTEFKNGEIDIDKVSKSLIGTIGSIGERYGVKIDDLNEIADKMDSQLPKDWYTRWKNDKQENMWSDASKQLLESNGRWMRVQGTNDSQRREILSAVSWIMVGRKVLIEENVNKIQESNMEVVRGEFVTDEKMKKIVRPEDVDEIVDAQIEELGKTRVETIFGEENSLDSNDLERVRQEFIESNGSRQSQEIRNNEAIVQFNGRVIEQVRVQDRNTCILAVMQMLLTHSGYIRGDAHVSLIEAKGEMIQLAKNVGALSENVGGTLELMDVEHSIVPVLEETERTLIASGKSENIDRLGNIGVGKIDLFDGYREIEVYDALMVGGGGERVQSASALAIMAGKWQDSKNMVFGYTHVDQIGQRNENGHQRIVNGISRIDNQYYFHVIDPLTKMSKNGWVKGLDLVTHLTGPIFWAESKEQSSKPSSVTREDLLEGLSTPRAKKNDKGHIIEFG